MNEQGQLIVNKGLVIVTHAKGLFVNQHAAPPSTNNARIGNAYPISTEFDSDMELITSENIRYSRVSIPNNPSVKGWVRMGENDGVTIYAVRVSDVSNGSGIVQAAQVIAAAIVQAAQILAAVLKK